MKLVIDPKWYSDVEETLLEIKKTGLQDECDGSFLHVIDGTWNLRTFTSWYRNQPNPRLANDPISKKWNRVEKYDKWFFYSTAGFTQNLETNAYAFLAFDSDKSFDFSRGYACAVVFNAYIRPTWDSPNEIDWEKRIELVNLIENMPLSYPEYPAWADSFPIAVLGDSIQHWRDEAGSIFCPINEEWALEISIEAWLHYRKPTDQEIQMIEKALP
jgi:hypothetical protein